MDTNPLVRLRALVCCLALLEPACSRPNAVSAVSTDRIESSSANAPTVRDVSGASTQVTVHTSDGWTIAGVLRQVDDGPAVLLVHAIGSDHTAWNPLVGLLHKRPPFNTLAIDVRGHGRSVSGPSGVTVWQAIDGDRRAWAGVASDMRAAIASLRASEPHRHVYIVAWTYGALAALSIANADPDIAGVALLSPEPEFEGESFHDLLATYLASGRHAFVFAGDPGALGAVGLLLPRRRDPAGSHAPTTIDVTSDIVEVVGGPFGARGESLLGSRPGIWTDLDDWLRYLRDGTVPHTDAPSPRDPPVPGEERRGPVLFQP